MSSRPCVTSKCNTFLDRLVQFVLPPLLVNFLNTQLVCGRYVYINLWSVVHFLFGAAFFLLWVKYSNNFLIGFFIWILLHSVWEAIEFRFAYKGLYPALFFEEYIDIIWDTIASQAGYSLAWFYWWLMR